METSSSARLASAEAEVTRARQQAEDALRRCKAAEAAEGEYKQEMLTAVASIAGLKEEVKAARKAKAQADKVAEEEGRRHEELQLALQKARQEHEEAMTRHLKEQRAEVAAAVDAVVAEFKAVKAWTTQQQTLSVQEAASIEDLRRAVAHQEGEANRLRIELVQAKEEGKRQVQVLEHELKAKDATIAMLREALNAERQERVQEVARLRNQLEEVEEKKAQAWREMRELMDIIKSRSTMEAGVSAMLLLVLLVP